MRNRKRDNFAVSECGMGTNGTGVQRKLDENVRDNGSNPLPESCKGKTFRGFNKKWTRKDALKQEKTETKIKREEETDDGKE